MLTSFFLLFFFAIFFQRIESFESREVSDSEGAVFLEHFEYIDPVTSVYYQAKDGHSVAEFFPVETFLCSFVFTITLH